MAVTDIQATVLRITGVSPTANSVEDGQRFVVSSVPKDLLMFAQKVSSASTDGSAISFSVNDSITDVQRNGYSCVEIPMSDAVWALDSSSLRFATAKRPVFYHKQGAVHFAPVTDGSNAGYVFYVDFSLIDDDCDLRNAVIFHAASSEFTKLSSTQLPTSAISFNSVPPDTPSITTVSYSGLGSDLDATSPTFSTATVSAATILGTTSNFNDYFESGSLNPLNDNDPGEFSLLTVPPDAPTVPDFNINIDTNLPTYTSLGDLTTMSAGDSQTTFTQWFDVVGDYIADEDVELSTAQIQKISTYIQAYSGEMQNNLNAFNTELQKYQAELSNELQEAQYEQQAEHASKIQQYQAEVAHYQAEVNTEVNEYTQKLQRYNTELGIVHQSWATMYQAAIQESIQELQVENQRNMAAAQAELQLNIDNENRSQQRQLQNAINDMQALLQDNQSKISKYQAETAVYQAESSNNIQEYQSKIQKQQAYSKEADKYYQWANAEVQIYIQNNSKMISSTMAAQASAQQRGR